MARTAYTIPAQINDRDEEQFNIKAEAAQIAKEQVSSGMWNLQSVIFLYAVSIATIIMAFKGVRLEIIVVSAIVGLSAVWIWGRFRYKRLYKHLYRSEIRHLQELTNEEGFNGLELVNNPVDENTAFLYPVTSPLTPRQREILSLIAEGSSNKQIAFQLHISERTIKNQIQLIFKKLDVGNRTQAVLVSIRNGWILPQIDEYDPNTILRTSDRT